MFETQGLLKSDLGIVIFRARVAKMDLEYNFCPYVAISFMVKSKSPITPSTCWRVRGGKGMCLLVCLTTLQDARRVVTKRDQGSMGSRFNRQGGPGWLWTFCNRKLYVIRLMMDFVISEISPEIGDAIEFKSPSSGSTSLKALLTDLFKDFPFPSFAYFRTSPVTFSTVLPHRSIAVYCSHYPQKNPSRPHAYSITAPSYRARNAFTIPAPSYFGGTQPLCRLL
ncbi:hypothetical protein J6590_051470 [Homalodisca vitripennis]|nr:hypothetical protein J6590_051470 [Homalodisca vitripennis]